MIKLNENLTQKQRIGVELENIKNEITKTDRRAFFDENPNYTHSMLSNYINGKIGDADEGLRVLAFFKNRIKLRENTLSEIK